MRELTDEQRQLRDVRDGLCQRPDLLQWRVRESGQQQYRLRDMRDGLYGRHDLSERDVCLSRGHYSVRWGVRDAGSHSVRDHLLPTRSDMLWGGSGGHLLPRGPAMLRHRSLCDMLCRRHHLLRQHVLRGRECLRSR